jgi:hypothetical protein
MFLDQPCAAVPAQNRIVIPAGANLLRLFVAAHGFFQQDQQGVRRAPGAQLSLGATLMQKTRIVEALVLIGELLESVICIRVAIG